MSLLPINSRRDYFTKFSSTVCKLLLVVSSSQATLLIHLTHPRHNTTSSTMSLGPHNLRRQSSKLAQTLHLTTSQIPTRSSFHSSSSSFDESGCDPTATPPSDTRSDVIRTHLYPPNTFSPKSSSPTGAHLPDHIARLRAILPNPEVYDTIERAWRVHTRLEKEQRERVLREKWRALEEACDELDSITSPSPSSSSSTHTDAGTSLYPRRIYTRAIARPNPHREELVRGRKATPESRFLEARIEGMVPREAWIGLETRGKGWNYGYKRPAP